MKKRLLMMLLLLCLLLTALTATVSAYNTNVNGKNVRITDVITYFCDRCHTAQTVVDDDYTIDGIQARTPSGTTKSLAEWKHGDSLVISVSVKDTVCSVCKETEISGGTFNVVIADVGYYCHQQFAPPNDLGWEF